MLGASTTGRQHVVNTRVSIYDAIAVELLECLSRFPKIESLKPEQKEALEFLLVTSLPFYETGFGKSLIYQVFCQAKLSSNPKNMRSSFVPLVSRLSLSFPFLEKPLKPSSDAKIRQSAFCNPCLFGNFVQFLRRTPAAEIKLLK